MGVPLLVPSPQLLAKWHTTLGLVGHKGPGNVPWRRSTDRKRVPNDAFAWLTHDTRGWFSAPPLNGDDHGCAVDPNDACDVTASLAWLRFAEPYTWPHVTTFESVDELIGLARSLLANRTRRLFISTGMKRFFAAEHARSVRHVRIALSHALHEAQQQRGL